MKWIIIFSLIIVGLRHTAQVINVESKKIKSEDGWAGNIDLSGKFTKNTSAVWQISNNANVQYKKLRNTYYLLSSQSLVRSNTSDLVNYGYLHLRYNYDLDTNRSRIIYEAFSQIQYNSVQRIKFRNLLGTGFKFNVFDEDSLSLDLGFAVMHEYEETSLPEYSSLLRNSNYLNFRAFITPRIQFGTISYIQPAITEFSDFRFTNETSISYAINDNYSVVVSSNVLYDSRPPEEVPNTVAWVKLFIRYKFKK